MNRITDKGQTWKEVTLNGTTHLELDIHSPSYGLQTIKIDVEDFEEVKSYKWYVEKHRTNKKTGLTVFYAMAHQPGKNRTPVRLHRHLLKPTKGMVVDHKLPIGTDCRRNNIHIVTQQANCRNNSTSLGVRCVPGYKTQPYEARLNAGYGNIIYTTHKDPQSAWTARIEMEKKYFGHTSKPDTIPQDVLQKLLNNYNAAFGTTK